MVKFLIDRPVAVFSVYIGMVILGVVASLYLPVSLLPDIDIPNINVQITVPNTSARELENTVVKKLRDNLLQTPALKDIKSFTQNGSSVIKLSFDYGRNMDFAYLDVNEKVDQTMGEIQLRIDRPKVIRASATDLPVLSISLFYRDRPSQENTTLHLPLSKFAKNTLKGRIEQLKNVALVDISGTSSERILIRLDPEKITSLNLDIKKIAEIIQQHNIELRSISIKEGFYEYDVKVPLLINDKSDIEQLSFKIDRKIITLADIAEVSYQESLKNGKYFYNGVPAVNLNVIKKENAKISELKNELYREIEQIKADYPNLELVISQDQTFLIETTIDNLKQSTLLSIIFAILIVIAFIRKAIPAILIIIVIPVSIAVSAFFLYLFNIPVSILSLAGIILSIGLMIDNSIILIENIYQYLEDQNELKPACIFGTNEIIIPLLSSTMTTCSVFLPLIFLSGVTGALFTDQVITIFVCLFSSFVVSVTFLPVLFYVLHEHQPRSSSAIRAGALYKYYKWLLSSHLKSRYIFFSLFMVLIFLNFPVFERLDIQSLPTLTQKEFLMKITWNEHLTIHENINRLQELFSQFESEFEQTNLYIGKQQFILDQRFQLAQNEAIAVIKTKHPHLLPALKDKLRARFRSSYPKATTDFESNESLFDIIFPIPEGNLKIGFQDFQTGRGLSAARQKEIIDSVKRYFPFSIINDMPKEEYFSININKEKLVRYEIDQEDFLNRIESELGGKYVGSLRNQSVFVPIYMAVNKPGHSPQFDEIMISNQQKELYPLNQLADYDKKEGYRYILAGPTGEYTVIQISSAQQKAVFNWIKEKYGRNFHVFSIEEGLQLDKLAGELFMVLLVAICLLYFILAIQFESFLQPLVILLEIPIGIFGVLFFLWITDSSINIMSITGIVIMSGIIINDSILKIDKINSLIRRGDDQLQAILEGGAKRLRPILMTTLTTIAALLPFLFSTGLGAELQKPLSVSIIGGLTIGTYVSLFFIPLLLVTFNYIHRSITSKH